MAIKKPEKSRPSKNGNASRSGAGEVLTLVETAAFLRVPEEVVLRLVGPDGLPGRLIDTEWRFLKSALQEWLRSPPPPSSPALLRAAAGAWKGDPTLEEMLRDIHERRGRPKSGDEA